MLGKADIENFVQFVITEYYPENAGDYLKKKRRLLEMAKKGRKGAKKQLSKEELTKIKELLDQEIREVFGTEANFFDQDEVMFEAGDARVGTSQVVSQKLPPGMKQIIIEDHFEFDDHPTTKSKKLSTERADTLANFGRVNTDRPLMK